MQRQLSLNVLVTPEELHNELRRDVAAGLGAAEKSLPSIWFYDERGSRLFDEITRLAEYYPTRVERSILAAHADQIAERTGADTLVEIGSGTSEKTRLLLDALARRGTLQRIVIFDISRDVLAEAAEELSEEYDVDVDAVVGDFRRHLGEIPTGGRKLWVFLGSTIGNLTPPERAQLLSGFRGQLGDRDHLLLGTDLVKEPRRLVAAYDDARGVTAEFNRNLLRVINRELDATFEESLFEHRAVWDRRRCWIEMRLRALSAHTVQVRALGLSVPFKKGEEIRTEISAKFHPNQVVSELATAGLALRSAWRDPRGDFQLALSSPR